MSFLPTRAVLAARPLLASVRAAPSVSMIPRLATRLAHTGYATDYAWKHDPPPKVYPPNWEGSFDSLNDDREPEFEPVQGPLRLPGEKPSDDPKLNGYPDFPKIHRRDKPESARYWNRQHRTNFGEPRHEEDEILTMWAPDPVSHMSGPELFKPFVSTIAIFLVFCWVVGVFVPNQQALPRAYPRDGLKGDFPDRIHVPSLDDVVYKLAEGDLNPMEGEEDDD